LILAGKTMSKSIAILGSHTSGHNGYPSTVVVEGTTKLTINGKPAALVGSHCKSHSKPKGGTHTPVIVSGASRVKVNGIEVAIVGSKTDCGDTIVDGDDLVQIS